MLVHNVLYSTIVKKLLRQKTVYLYALLRLKRFQLDIALFIAFFELLQTN